MIVIHVLHFQPYPHFTPYHPYQMTDSESSQKTDVTQPASQPSEASGSEEGGPKPSTLFNVGSAQVQTVASEGGTSAEVDEGEIICVYMCVCFSVCSSVHVFVCICTCVHLYVYMMMFAFGLHKWLCTYVHDRVSLWLFGTYEDCCAKNWPDNADTYTVHTYVRALYTV